MYLKNKINARNDLIECRNKINKVLPELLSINMAEIVIDDKFNFHGIAGDFITGIKNLNHNIKIKFNKEYDYIVMYLETSYQANKKDVGYLSDSCRICKVGVFNQLFGIVDNRELPLFDIDVVKEAIEKVRANNNLIDELQLRNVKTIQDNNITSFLEY